MDEIQFADFLRAVIANTTRIPSEEPVYYTDQTDMGQEFRNFMANELVVQKVVRRNTKLGIGVEVMFIKSRNIPEHVAVKWVKLSGAHYRAMLKFDIPGLEVDLTIKQNLIGERRREQRAMLQFLSRVKDDIDFAVEERTKPEELHGQPRGQGEFFVSTMHDIIQRTMQLERGSLGVL